MYIAPDSTIEFYKTNLDKSYNDTLYFQQGGAGIAAQREYFNSVLQKEIDENSYIRKNVGVIYVELPISELYKYDYMGYNNLQYENKWFYAFIDKVEYINNETTAVYFTIDVMQTWFPWCTLRKSFIIRKHTYTDNLYEHTLEEDIGIGDKTAYYVEDSCPELRDMSVVAVSLFKDDGKTQAPITVVNGVYQGLNYLEFTTKESLQTWLYTMTDNGNINDITSIFMFPHALMSVSGVSPTITKNIAKNQINMITGYVPKNKKLLCYPYNFLEISNNEGNIAVYRLENFKNTGNNAVFSIEASVSGTPTVAIIPNNYELEGRETPTEDSVKNYAHMLTIQNYPQCSWAIDTFRAYSALNQNVLSNMANVQFPLMRQHGQVGAVTSGIGAIASLLKGDVGGIVSGATNAIFSLKDTEAEISAKMAQIADLQLQPPQIAGNVSGSITASTYYKTFEIRRVSITEEQAKIIDEYFSLYGYKVNSFELPLCDSRPHWTYLKLMYTNITGDIPADDIIQIKRIFENGIRFWNHGNEFLNYTLDNSPY